MSEFHSNTQPVARKDHKCYWCGEVILKDEKHYRAFGKNRYGDLYSYRCHLECSDAWGKYDFYEDEGPEEGEFYRGSLVSRWNSNCHLCGTAEVVPCSICDQPVCCECRKVINGECICEKCDESEDSNA